jgi:two-component system chemotaxis sensor kinase CheA
MSEKDTDFLSRLLSTFKVEAEEHLKFITAGLLELEKTPTTEKQMAIIENIFREAHSLKGASRAVNMKEIEALCQSLESLFAAWKRRDLAPSPELFDVLHQTVDRLGQLLASTDREPSAAVRAQLRKLGEELEKALTENPPAAEQEIPEKTEQDHPEAPQAEAYQFLADGRSVSAETVRVGTAKLDAVLLKTEELLSAKLTTGQHVADLKKINTTLSAWKRHWAKMRREAGTTRRNFVNDTRDGAAGNGRLTKNLELLDWTHHAITGIESKLAALERSVEQDHRVIGGMVDDLLAEMKNLLMFPFGSILESFPSLVRNLARDQGKEVELVTEGAEIEVDRRILEEMKDPLIHLIRNCIDHGMETPEEREKKKKPRRATIRVSVAQKSGRKVEILVSDDGKGIDLIQVRASALKLGQITHEEVENLGDQGTLALIFRSGVSTSAMITNLSGRGLGLAIVHERAEKLGGVVTVDSSLGIGTTFRVVLPLTMATFRGIPVRVGEHLFVLPSKYVARVARVERTKVQTVENKETIQLDGGTVSLVHLGDALELPRKNPTEDAKDTVLVVLITLNEKLIAFLIDEVFNEQEMLIKSLGRQLSRVRNVAGATVLATRKLAPVLNVSDLMKSAVKMGNAALRAAPLPLEEPTAKKTSVLVVEDSITSRALLKNILEAAGYDVNTAVDGVDGFTQLRSGAFDIVVSDVEMPRMNGFDLTARIRDDKKFSELPVILVTALESRQDKERGVDVGANAYIVKSSFDQSNLLEVIQRLV